MIPLRIAGRRFWLWGLVFSLASAAVICNSPNVAFVDFPQFWAAGRTVGSPDLLDPARHGAWEVLHGIVLDFFPYPPATAWLFAPFAAFSLPVGFWLHALAMTALVGIGGILGARLYGLDDRVGMMGAFAWGPCMASVSFGQNAPLGLVFALLAIEGLRRDSYVLAGLGVGLLLYKPTLAIPLLGLMLLRRRWRALGVAAVVGCGWYVLSVGATAGDWAWPGQFVAGLGDWYHRTTAFNPAKATSISGVLIGYGAPAIVAWGISLAVVILSIPRLLKAPMVEAGAGACLLGLAVSPHSLNYEAVLALPAILWMLGGTGAGISEPARTRLIVAVYVAGLAHLISTWAGLSSVGVAVLALTAIWISGWQRFETTPGSPADPAPAQMISVPLPSPPRPQGRRNFVFRMRVGRDRHAVVRHNRCRIARGRQGHDPRPRLDGAGQSGHLAGEADRHGSLAGARG